MPTYKGLLIYQRIAEETLPLFVFAATAKEILSWSKVLQTAKVQGAAQRLENLAHIKSIGAYVAAASFNIIPTAVTIAVEDGNFKLTGLPSKKPAHPAVLEATLKVTEPAGSDDAGKPGFVIDGQHRLRALAESSEDIPVVVTAILGADRLERALHFVVINNKAKRVSADLVRGIVAELPDDEEKNLRQRLVAVGLTLGNYSSALEVLGSNPNSPFCKLIDWDINRDGQKRVKPQALEGALRALVANLRSPDRLEIDDAVDLLIAMWRGVVEAWGSVKPVWYDENSKLADKASVVAVTEFLIERSNLKIEEGFDIGDLHAVQAFCKGVMSGVPPTFWLAPWNKKELDTSTGRILIKQSLAEVRRASASRLEDPVSSAPLVGPVESVE